MSNDGKAVTPFGVSDADILLAMGWGQGSVFRPNEHVRGPHGDLGSAYLVLCSQSCVVVSPNLARDPQVEVAVGLPVQKHKARSPQATGEDARKFHLRVSGADFEALEVNVNKRFTLDRAALLRFEPDAIGVDETACRDLAGWLGRYYTRVALPNELVRRLDRSWFGKLKTFLRSDPKLDGLATMQEAVHSAYIRWRPDAELPSEQDYEVDFLFLGRDSTGVEALERGLITQGVDLEARCKTEGIDIAFAAQSCHETFVSDLDGRVRFTHWDYMSGLGEAAAVAP